MVNGAREEGKKEKKKVKKKEEKKKEKEKKNSGIQCSIVAGRTSGDHV